MTDHHKRLAGELFDRICRCLEFADGDLQFAVQQTQGGWFDMSVCPVGEVHVVFDMKTLLGIFDGGYFDATLHLSAEHKFKLIGLIEGKLFHVSFRTKERE